MNHRRRLQTRSRRTRRTSWTFHIAGTDTTLTVGPIQTFRYFRFDERKLRHRKPRTRTYISAGDL